MRACYSFSPVVHAKTAYLDYRPTLYARPMWFVEQDTKAALRVIKQAKTFAHGLRERERWLYYIDDHMVMYGVVAAGRYFSDSMTHELVLDGGREIPRREIDAFVGLAIRRTALADVLMVPKRDRALFQNLYSELIGPRWRERQTESSWEQPTLSTPVEIGVELVDASTFCAGRGDQEGITFRRFAEDDEAWRTGTIQRRNTLLGLTKMDDARTPLFSIVTAGDVGRNIELPHSLPVAAQTRPMEQPLHHTEPPAANNTKLPPPIFQKSMRSKPAVRKQSLAKNAELSPPQPNSDLGIATSDAYASEVSADHASLNPKFDSDPVATPVARQLDQWPALDAVQLSRQSDVSEPTGYWFSGVLDVAARAYSSALQVLAAIFGEHWRLTVQRRSGMHASDPHGDTPIATHPNHDVQLPAADADVDQSDPIGQAGPVATDIVGTPLHDAQYWEHQTTDFSCDVECQRGIIESLTGEHVSEAQLCTEAAERGWLTSSGGTSIEDCGKLLELHGVSTHAEMHARVGDIYEELALGHKVIVGVRGEDLWDTNSPFMQSSGGGANHAIWVTGIDKSDPSNVKVIINDSGDPNGAGKSYALGDFTSAWEKSGYFYLATDKEPPNLHQDVPDFDPESHTFPDLVHWAQDHISSVELMAVGAALFGLATRARTSAPDLSSKKRKLADELEERAASARTQRDAEDDVGPPTPRAEAPARSSTERSRAAGTGAASSETTPTDPAPRGAARSLAQEIRDQLKLKAEERKSEPTTSDSKDEKPQPDSSSNVVNLKARRQG